MYKKVILIICAVLTLLFGTQEWAQELVKQLLNSLIIGG